jgi:VanZ family protein
VGGHRRHKQIALREHWMGDSSKWTTAATGVFVAYAVALFISTHIPISHEAVLPGTNDKHLHLLAYSGLSVLAVIRLAVLGAARLVPWGLWMAALTAAAGLDELTQVWVGRSGDWADWQADVAGLWLAGTLTLGWLWMFPKVVGRMSGCKQSEFV